MPGTGGKRSEGPVTVYPNNDRRYSCEEQDCALMADLNVKLGSPPSGRGHYWCVTEHWLQVHSLLIGRKVKISYAEGAMDRIVDRLQRRTTDSLPGKKSFPVTQES